VKEWSQAVSVNKRNFNFTISQELIDNMKKLEGDFRRQIQNEALSKAGQIIKNEAKRLVPVYSGSMNVGHYKYPNKKGKTRSPGTLRRSIIFKLIEFKQIDRTVGLFSVKNPVGHLVEYGHRTKKGRINKGLLAGTYPSGSTMVRPQPYARPAVAKGEREIINSLESSLKKIITEL